MTTQSIARWMLVAPTLLCPACLVPPPDAPAASSAPRKLAEAATPSRFYEGSWADCSGTDGNGGVKLNMGPKKIAQRREDLPLTLVGDAATKSHGDWLVYRSPDGHALSFEWVWVTTQEDKFWGKMWAGTGLAMNRNWSPIDISAAKYLVFYAKASEPTDGGDLSLKLSSDSDRKGQKETGSVLLSAYAEGGKLGTEWTRVVIPLSSFPDVGKVDLERLFTIGFDVTGKYPENKPVSIRVDNVYFSDIDMVTQVQNLGWTANARDVSVVWDKRAGERISEFAVLVDGKLAKRVGAAERHARLKLEPGAHTISVVTQGGKESSSPATTRAVVVEDPPANATVDVTSPGKHPVPPYFNSTNFMTAEELRDAGFNSTRWGGNATSKYNYMRDLSSSGADWFYLNQQAKPEGTREENKSYYKFIRDAREAGADVNFTVPMMPWIAKPSEGDRLCSFPASAYPKQHRIGTEKCGDGLMPDGKTKITGNDPTIAMLPNSPDFQRGLVSNIKKLFPGGVKFYTLDNEPGLWHETHRDVFPKGYTTDELLGLSVKYATMIKAVDPASQVIGLASWGMMELAGSPADYTSDWSDRKAHGGSPNLVSFIRGMKQASEAQGKRLLDVVDAHWYPEVYFVKDGKKLRLSDDIEFDPIVADKQFEALREFWDPTFELTANGLESWTFGEGNNVKLWDPFHPTIPALKRTIEQAWPGTKLAFNEYSSGSGTKYHGGLLRAALLGIFMQEDLFMAQVWGQPGKDSFTFYAHKLYGNYDSKGGRVRGAFVPTTSSNRDLLTYATRDGARTYVVLVNKNQKQPVNAAIKLPADAKRAQSFTISQSLGLRIFAGEPSVVAGKQANVHIPAFAAQLVVLE